jgi:hypothetical protein
MASFTDAIPQFNPYIQQLPVEAMVAVGMEKQQRYDQGLQRIQSQIDQVAGLDIVRDVDRQYLQSKLNELGSKLKTVAAGDFSNYQLVNSVAGMAGSVAKDNNVLSSVQATAQYRKEQKFMEESRQKGESAIQNEYDFNAQANRWINDSNVGAGFSGRYRKYIDVDKKWLEVLKSLHSDLIEQDIPYEYNEDGTLNRAKTAEVMQRMSSESVSANKIENALRASLSADELEQLNITGRYQFRNINTPEEIAVYSRTKFGSMISQNEQTIKDLEGRKALASSDPNTLLKIDEGLKSLQEINRKLVEDMNSEIKMLSTDIEGAKGYIYRKGAIEQFANAHAWETQKSNLLTNPVNTYRMDDAKHQLNLSEFNQRQIEFDWKKSIDQANLDLKLLELDMKNNGTMPEDNTIYGGEPTGVIKNQQGALLKEINESNDFYQSTVNDVLNALGPNVTREQLENAIELYDNGDAKQFENIVPLQFRAAINQATKARKSARDLEIYRTEIMEKVEKSSPLVAEYNAELQELSQEIKPVTIDGVTFSSQEIRNYLNKMKSVSKTSVESGITVVRSEYEPIGQLSQKEELLRKRRYDVARENIEYVSTVNKYQDVINKAIESQMAKDNGVFIPTLNPIILSTEQGNVARNRMENLTSGFLQRYSGDILSGMKGGDEKLSKENVQKALGWLGESDKSVLQYGLVTQGNSYYITVRKGTDEVVVPINASDLSKLPVKTNITQTTAYQSLIKQQSKFNGNTNPTGDFKNSYFDRVDIPNVTYNVRADLTQQYGDPNRQYVTLRVMTPKGVIPYQYPESLNAVGAMSFISKLTDQDVKQLYLRSNIHPEWKKLIEDL